MQKYLPLLGRSLLAMIFLMSGASKIGNFAGTQAYMAQAGMPLTALFLVAAILLEIGGSLSIIAGFKARFGALALIVFLIPTTLIFHNNLGDQMQMIMFMKNIAILGGLLLIAFHGAGPLSLDERGR